jgi:hypothetical protein
MDDKLPTRVPSMSRIIAFAVTHEETPIEIIERKAEEIKSSISIINGIISRIGIRTTIINNARLIFEIFQRYDAFKLALDAEHIISDRVSTIIEKIRPTLDQIREELRKMKYEKETGIPYEMKSGKDIVMKGGNKKPTKKHTTTKKKINKKKNK